MSKPIKITDDIRETITTNFLKALDDYKMMRGEFKFSQAITYAKEAKAVIVLSIKAYIKIQWLIQQYEGEVAWHGVGERLETENGVARFLISDVVTYPQDVSGARVEMDPVKYTRWIIDHFEDDRYQHIVMQGHNHVNFGVTPSAVDLAHQEEILSQQKDDQFYIFMIWNKKGDRYSRIFDSKNNIEYETGDITYEFVKEEFDEAAFKDEAEKLITVKKAKPVTATTSYPPYYGTFGANNGAKGQQSAWGGKDTAKYGEQKAAAANKNKKKKKWNQKTLSWEDEGETDTKEPAGPFGDKYANALDDYYSYYD